MWVLAFSHADIDETWNDHVPLETTPHLYFPFPCLKENHRSDGLKYMCT
jgi:hypothetical protein